MVIQLKTTVHKHLSNKHSYLLYMKRLLSCEEKKSEAGCPHNILATNIRALEKGESTEKISAGRVFLTHYNYSGERVKCVCAFVLLCFCASKDNVDWQIMSGSFKIVLIKAS